MAIMGTGILNNYHGLGGLTKVYGIRFGVQDLGFRVQGLGFRGIRV